MSSRDLFAESRIYATLLDPANKSRDDGEDILNLMAVGRRSTAIKLRAFPLRRRPATCSRDPG